jgi:hypothetical protein
VTVTVTIIIAVAADRNGPATGTVTLPLAVAAVVIYTYFSSLIGHSESGCQWPGHHDLWCLIMIMMPVPVAHE